MVQYWEKLRPKEVPVDQKAELVAKILKKAKGKIAELANNHSASRVVQFCIKYGGPRDKQTILEELKDNLLLMAKTKHGHYLVQKVINNCSKDEFPGILKQFKGQVSVLLRHPQGSDVLMDLYEKASTQQRNALVAEVYGREFTLFDGVAQRGEEIHHLKELLGGAGAGRRIAVIQHMTKALAPVMEKALLQPPMVHRLLKEYLEEAPASVVQDAVDTLSQVGGNVLKMVHTHEGAQAACMVVCYGTAKDRKRLVRSMKGYVNIMATNEWGHAVLCAALSVVDDTQMMVKMVISELQEHLSELVSDKHGRRVLLHLLCPGNRRYVPEAIQEMMAPPEKKIKVAIEDKEGGAEEGEEGKEEGAEALEEDLEDVPEDEDEMANDDDDDDDDADNNDDGIMVENHDKDGSADGVGEHSQGEDIDGVANGGAVLEEVVLGLSKKDPLARRQELLGNGKPSLASSLIEVCHHRAGALMRSQQGCDVVVEVARGGAEGVLHTVDPEGVRKVHEALVASALKSRDQLQEDPQEVPEVASTSGGDRHPADELLVGYFSSRALRRLILMSTEEGPGGEAAREFCDTFYKGVLQGRCKAYLGTHADKVLAAMATCGSSSTVKAMKKELKPLLKVPLEQWCLPFLGPQGDPGLKEERSQKKKK